MKHNEFKIKRLLCKIAYQKIRVLFYLIALFLFSRIIVITGFLYGFNFVKLYDSFKYPLLRYDSFFYMSIALHGYRIYNDGRYSNVVFFPFYPLLTHFFSFLFRLPIPLSMELISNIFGCLSVILFYKFALFYMNEKKALFAAMFFLFFPMSIYLTAAYARPALIFFAILTFYVLKINKHFLGAVFAGISSSIHPTGIAVSIGVISFFLISLLHSFNFKKIIIFLFYSIISLSGILLFIVYLTVFFHQPFAFVSYQNNLGYLGKMSFKTQVIRAITLFPFFSAHRIFDFRLNEFQFVFFVIMAIIAFKNKFFDIWIDVFMLSVIFIIYFEHIVRINSFEAAPRLSYIAFPAFYTLELLIANSKITTKILKKNKSTVQIKEYKNIKKTYLILIFLSIFSIMLFYFSVLFYQGYWIDF